VARSIALSRDDIRTLPSSCSRNVTPRQSSCNNLLQGVARINIKPLSRREFALEIEAGTGES